MTAIKPVTTADLWHAADVILRPQRVRLPDDGIFKRWSNMPSLWDQLNDSIRGAAGGKASGGFKSRSPLNTQALSLQVEIKTAIRDERMRRKLPWQASIDAELHAVIRDVIDKGDAPIFTDDEDGPSWWGHMHALLQAWAGRIRAITDRSTTRLHRAQCPTCKSTTVPAFDSEGQEAGRQPALIVHFLDDTVLKVVCDYCAGVITSEGLNALWHSARAASK